MLPSWTMEDAMKQIEKIAWRISDTQLRLALMAAVFFADNNRAAFRTKAGSYSVDGLDRLLEEEAEQTIT